jgi:ribosome-associated protein
MDIRKLQRVIVDALEDVKAQDIRVYNTQGQSDLFDRVMLASATSNRQARALASNVAEKVKQAGGTVISVEGEEGGEWLLVDLGDAIVHIMQPAIRDYYNLEEIWGSKPVQLKLGGAEPTAPILPPPSPRVRTTRREASDEDASKAKLGPARARRSRTAQAPAQAPTQAPARPKPAKRTLTRLTRSRTAD